MGTSSSAVDPLTSNVTVIVSEFMLPKGAVSLQLEP